MNDVECRYAVHIEGERGGERTEKSFLCLNFSCLAIKYEFYFIQPKFVIGIQSGRNFVGLKP